jgi:hypothetical protein
MKIFFGAEAFGEAQKEDKSDFVLFEREEIAAKR